MSNGRVDVGEEGSVRKVIAIPPKLRTTTTRSPYDIKNERLVGVWSPSRR